MIHIKMEGNLLAQREISFVELIIASLDNLFESRLIYSYREISDPTITV